MEKFRVELDNSAYLPGQTVTGIVAFRLKSPANIRGANFHTTLISFLTTFLASCSISIPFSWRLFCIQSWIDSWKSSKNVFDIAWFNWLSFRRVWNSLCLFFSRSFEHVFRHSLRLFSEMGLFLRWYQTSLMIVGKYWTFFWGFFTTMWRILKFFFGGGRGEGFLRFFEISRDSGMPDGAGGLVSCLIWLGSELLQVWVWNVQERAESTGPNRERKAAKLTSITTSPPRTTTTTKPVSAVTFHPEFLLFLLSPNLIPRRFTHR